MLDLLQDEQRNEARFENLESTSEKGELKISAKVNDVLIAGAFEAMNRERRMSTVEMLLKRSLTEKILTQNELWNICSYYGLGDGFEKMTNEKIAQKLQCTPGAASKQRKAAQKKLYDFLTNDPVLKAELF